MSKGAFPRSLGIAVVVVIVAVAAVSTTLRVRNVLDEGARADEEQQERIAVFVVELVEMRQTDQEIRNAALGHVPDDQARTPERLAHLGAEADRTNGEHAVRLREIVAEMDGWPVRSRVGDQATTSACVIAVHAYHDPAFMQWAAEEMEPHVAGFDVDTDCYAKLVDRIAVVQNLPQRYGTQFRSEERDGVFFWGVAPIEDPVNLLARRAELDLMDYATYLEIQRGIYEVPDSVQPYPDEPVIPGLERGPVS